MNKNFYLVENLDIYVLEEGGIAISLEKEGELPLAIIFKEPGPFPMFIFNAMSVARQQWPDELEKIMTEHERN